MEAYLINMHLLVPRSRSSAKVKVKNIKVTFFKKWLFRGHSCFTNTSCFFVYFQFTTRSDIDDYNQFLVLLIEFLPSIVIGVLNGIYPLLFELLVLAENYRPATVVKLTLIRLVLEFFMPPIERSGGILFYCCLSICLSAQT